jgi:hypothetical protein
MTGPDGEFDDFLTRRKPVFRRPENDPLEPPPELDRIVLRRAREAIEADQSEPAYHGTRWGMPVALAATLLVVFSVFLHLGVQSTAPVGEVSVQTVAQQVDSPDAVPAPAPEVADIGPRSGARERAGASPGFVTESEASRYSLPPPPPPVVAGRTPAEVAEPSPGVGTSSTQAWRRDARTWLAEIDKMRAEGKVAEADAEMAEYKRQHRAYAGTPDR